MSVSHSSRRLAQLIAALLFVSTFHAEAAAATFLLKFHDAAGKPVRLISATLFITWYGGYEHVDLPFKDDGVTFDPSVGIPTWARDDWSKLSNEFAGILFVKTNRNDRLISEPFKWPASDRPYVAIDFRNGRSVTVREGESAELTVALQRPVMRVVRFVDDLDRAMARLNVTVELTWDTPNHCGYFVGREPLLRGTTDSRGELRVPFGDGDYPFTLGTRNMVFANERKHRRH